MPPKDDEEEDELPIELAFWVSRAISALFAEDYDRIWRRMVGWSNPELRGDEYVLNEDVSQFLADQPEEAKT